MSLRLSLDFVQAETGLWTVRLLGKGVRLGASGRFDQDESDFGEATVLDVGEWRRSSLAVGPVESLGMVFRQPRKGLDPFFAAPVECGEFGECLTEHVFFGEDLRVVAHHPFEDGGPSGL